MVGVKMGGGLVKALVGKKAKVDSWIIQSYSPIHIHPSSGPTPYLVQVTYTLWYILNV